MPKYDYFCAENGQVVEVRHGMMVDIKTWGELCGQLGSEVGDTSVDVPVERLMSGGTLLVAKRSGSHHEDGGEGGCSGGGGCGGDCGGCDGNCSCHH